MEIKNTIIIDKRRISFNETLLFTKIEKDILDELLKDRTKSDLINYYKDHIEDKSYKIKCLAADHNIKVSWAYIVLDIAKKLMYRDLYKGTPLKRKVA